MSETPPPLHGRIKESLLYIALPFVVVGGAIAFEIWTGEHNVPFLFVSGPILVAANTLFWTLAAAFPFDDAIGRARTVRVGIAIRDIGFWVGMIILIAYGSAGFFLAGRWVLERISEGPSAQGAVGVAVLGLVFFLLRLKLRSTYGGLEVILGIIIGANTYAKSFTHGVTDIKPSWSSADLALGVLTAGVYLVVRGLDNVQQGIEKDPKDPLAGALWRRLKRNYASARSKSSA
jgi:hypothetical protein